MSQQQAAHRMTDIILPGDNREKFEYFQVVEIPRGIPIAMVKFPESLSKPFKKALDEEVGREILWFLTNRQSELDEDDENATSRYELRGFVYQTTMIDTENFEPQEFIDKMEKDSLQDGYIYFPKALRDGKHTDRYILQPILEDHFTTRTERGMFEEVTWSPFGSIEEATKQEATNLERNPLMRKWT